MSTNQRTPDASPRGEPRVALVIGGTRGIGEQVAVGLRRRGYRVHVVGRREPAGRATASRVGATASRIGATEWRADASEMTQVQDLADRFIAERARTIGWIC